MSAPLDHLREGIATGRIQRDRADRHLGPFAGIARLQRHRTRIGHHDPLLSGFTVFAASLATILLCIALP